MEVSQVCTDPAFIVNPGSFFVQTNLIHDKMNIKSSYLTHLCLAFDQYMYTRFMCLFRSLYDTRGGGVSEGGEKFRGGGWGLASGMGRGKGDSA